MKELLFDSLNEECGIFGMYQKNVSNISEYVYYALITLQHRGQESAGIASYNNGKIKYVKDMGLVREVFNDESTFDELKGNISIGHVRYSTTGESHRSNAQPLVFKHKGGNIAIAHNGNLTNDVELREELEDKGSIFQTSIDTEVIAHLIAKSYKGDYKSSILSTVKKIKGAFAIVMICDDKLIAARDPYGIRPLCVGKIDDSYVVSSESCTFNVLGAEYLYDINPGEIVIFDKNGVERIQYTEDTKSTICAFEYVYFSRPDSSINGISVNDTRIKAGNILADNDKGKINVDTVICVPDSGTVSALGYAEQSKKPYRQGLLKNKYLGRTFIHPNQKVRELLVSLKLSVLKENIKDKSIVMVDDSIVRGTTSKKIVKMLKDAGAKEVHLRVSSPAVKHSCFYGIDTPERTQLVASHKSIEEIKDIIGADSLKYLTIDELITSIGVEKENLCLACFNGDYPIKKCKKDEKE